MGAQRLGREIIRDRERDRERRPESSQKYDFRSGFSQWRSHQHEQDANFGEGKGANELIRGCDGRSKEDLKFSQSSNGS
jgi:hypothetical protein